MIRSGDQRDDNNKVVFTEMKEFVWGLRPHRDDDKDPETEDDQEHIMSSISVQETKDLFSVKETETPAKDQDVVPTHEPAVGKGLAGALRLLKDRGTLKDTGRNTDKKKSKLVNAEKEINIDRTDEYGRTLTPKEAFRQLSHQFHGKRPGKTKQEKRMRQYQEELKVKQMRSSDTPSLAVEKMREAQAKLQTPYLVLSGHVKPAGDTRYRFATVETDFAGGSTPMLGDKKVENLNIKRRPKPGDDSSNKKRKT